MATIERSGLGNTPTGTLDRVITHHPDHVGSNTVSVTTTATSQTTSAIYLDPFGQKLGGSAPTSYVFTDQERDADSGLDYFGARYYDAMIGRFISQDPELVSAHNGITFDRIQGDTQHHNAFSYVLNRPTRLVDPTGRYSDGWLRPPQLPPIIIDKREKIVLTPDGGFMSFAGGSTSSATINQGGQTVNVSRSSLIGRSQSGATAGEVQDFALERTENWNIGRFPEKGEFFLPPDARHGLGAVFGGGGDE